MVMDQEPKPLTRDIQIRIPGQDTAPMHPVVAPPPAAAAQSESVNSPAALAAPVKPETVPPPASGTAAPTPAKAAAPADAKPKRVAAAQWILQLGAYEDQANVRLLLAKLKELGYPSYTEKVKTAQGPRTRVRGGPFATRRAAEKAQAQLKKIGAGGPPGGVVAQKQ
ncbi:cell division protein DedD [mine drainage metagenome]|uniref:Cell division protein DedD n=1 Tax=mine drainage metagenome TaxID=410659 RepID=A0A1J5R378_9ZZZZ